MGLLSHTIEVQFVHQVHLVDRDVASSHERDDQLEQKGTAAALGHVNGVRLSASMLARMAASACSATAESPSAVTGELAPMTESNSRSRPSASRVRHPACHRGSFNR